MRYALVKDGAVVRFQNDIDTTAQTKPGFKWLACPQVAPPTFDSAVELIDGPTYSVGASAVTEIWTKRNLTAQELRDRKDAKLSAIDMLQFQIAFDMENRVRVLEGKAVVTAAQYRTALKARL